MDQFVSQVMKRSLATNPERRMRVGSKPGLAMNRSFSHGGNMMIAAHLLADVRTRHES